MSKLSSSYNGRPIQFTVKKCIDLLNVWFHLNNLDCFLFSKQFRQKDRMLFLKRMFSNCNYESIAHIILFSSLLEKDLTVLVH